MTTGLVRVTTIPAYAQGSSQALAMTERGELLIAEALPRLADVVRQGGSFYKVTDAVAAVTAVPTTTAPHSLWNGESAGGPSYVVDRISWICTTSNAAASRFTMVAMLNKAAVASQPATADTATTVSTLDGSDYTGKALSSHTVTVVNDNWFQLGPSVETALSATVGASLEAECLFIVKPGYLLNVAIVAQSTTALGKVAFRLHKVQLTVA